MVRFKKDIPSPGPIYPEMRLPLRNPSLPTPSHLFGKNEGASEYFKIPQGSYMPQCREYGGWYNCFDQDYDFKVGHKYTIGLGEQGFYITDDGKFYD